MKWNAVLYVLLIGASVACAGEFSHIIREWWRDVKLRREINRRGDYLRPGWTIEGTERFRGRLGDAQDSQKKKKNREAS